MTFVLVEIFFANKITSVALAMHSRPLSADPHMMSLNIDMKIIRPLSCEVLSFQIIRRWNCSGSPFLVMNSWTLLMSCNVVNPGKYSTRIPSAHHQLCPKFCTAVNL